MLQYIRNRAQGTISWIIVGLIIIPFALWGINNYENEIVVSVANVNGVDITQREYQNEYQRERSRLQSMYGENFDIELLGEQRIKQGVIDRLVETELLRQTGVDEGFWVSDAQLSLSIQSIDAFQGDHGFDRERYERALLMQGMQVPEFEASYRRALFVDQKQTGIINSSFSTANEIEALTALSEQQRELSYLIVPVDQFIENAVVSDDALQSYYDANKERYAIPEKVSLQYVELSVDGVAKSVEVTDEEVRELYDDRLAELTEEEQRRASHILILVDEETDNSSARKKAEGLLERIKSGEDFAELAKEFSQDPGSAELGGDLDFFGKGVMDEAFEESAFSLKIGEISEPVKSSFGYHLIKLTDARGGETKPFEEVIEQLKEDIVQQKAADIFLDQAEILANLAYETPENLNAVADELDLPIQKTSFFSRGQGDGIAKNPKVNSAAFSDDVLGERNNSEVLEIANDRLVVVRIDQHEDSSIRPFKEVEDTIKNDLRRTEAFKLVELEGGKLLADMKSGADGNKLANENGYEWKEPGFVTRNNQEVNRSILDHVFKTEKPVGDEKIISGITLPSGDYVVTVVSGIKAGEAYKVGTPEWQGAEQMQNRMHGMADLTGYIKTLKSEADITYKTENF